MHLTDEEERMASGERGEAVRLSMEILTKVGAIYGAERMVEVNSVHASAVYPHLIASVELMEKYARIGGRFSVPTTVNPAHTPLNFDKWKEFREEEGLKEKCSRLVRAIMKMGVIPNWSCIPYFQGNLPRMGEPVAWVESSAVSFANSVLGARANRMAAGIDIPVAITGRAPEFGLYLEENRGGNALVRIESKPRTLFDYHTLGYIIGKRFSDRIPVIEGLPEQTTTNQLKAMGASASSRGVVPLYHAVGLTPEAKTREQAFLGRRPSAEINITEKDVKAVLEEITTYRGGGISMPSSSDVLIPFWKRSENSLFFWKAEG